MQNNVMDMQNESKINLTLPKINLKNGKPKQQQFKTKSDNPSIITFAISQFGLYV